MKVLMVLFFSFLLPVITLADPGLNNCRQAQEPVEEACDIETIRRAERYTAIAQAQQDCAARIEGAEGEDLPAGCSVQQTEAASQSGQETLTELDRVNAACQEAQQTCTQTCQTELQAVAGRYPPPNNAPVPGIQNQIMDVHDSCTEAAEEHREQSALARLNVNDMMMAAAMLMQALTGHESAEVDEDTSLSDAIDTASTSSGMQDVAGSYRGTGAGDTALTGLQQGQIASGEADEAQYADGSGGGANGAGAAGLASLGSLNGNGSGSPEGGANAEESIDTRGGGYGSGGGSKAGGKGGSGAGYSPYARGRAAAGSGKGVTSSSMGSNRLAARAAAKLNARRAPASRGNGGRPTGAHSMDNFRKVERTVRGPVRPTLDET